MTNNAIENVRDILGGPAFPSGNEVRIGERLSPGHPGASLFDIYVGHALAGLLANSARKNSTNDAIAKEAVAVALATIRIRNAEIESLVEKVVKMEKGHGR